MIDVWTRIGARNHLVTVELQRFTPPRMVSFGALLFEIS